MSQHEDQAIAEFRDAMRDAGVLFSGEIMPNATKIQRFHIDGDRAGSLNGSYKLHIDEHPRGVFWDWKRNEKHAWVSRRDNPMTADEKLAWESRMAQNKRELDLDIARLQAESQKKAESIWNKAWPATADFPYLKAKQVEPHGLRISRGSLVVPMRDVHGAFHSLHFISSKGEKKFLEHGRVQGKFYCMGDIGQHGRVWVGEGYATMATIRQLTGDPCVAALNAGNLKPVSMAVRQAFPNTEIIIAADSDRWTKKNPGLNKGLSAAQCVNGHVAVPWFPDVKSRPTDWNDMLRMDGPWITKRSLLYSVMSPERYQEATVKRDAAWERYALDNGWSRESVSRGMQQRSAERGMSMER